MTNTSNDIPEKRNHRKELTNNRVRRSLKDSDHDKRTVLKILFSF